jgi:hypothetical protein
MGTPDGVTGVLRAALDGNQGAAVRKPAQARLAHPPPCKGQMLDAPRASGHPFIPMWPTTDLLANVTPASQQDEDTGWKR